MKLIFATFSIKMFIIEDPFESDFFPNPSKRII